MPGYGFVLNDSMDDGSVVGRPNGTGYQPTQANYRKRIGSLGSRQREIELTIKSPAARNRCRQVALTSSPIAGMKSSWLVAPLAAVQSSLATFRWPEMPW